jgi:hypothetical protein
MTAPGHSRRFQLTPATSGLLRTTDLDQPGWSVSCHFRTPAVQQGEPPFYHLVGAGKQHGGHVESERLGGLEINYQLEFCGSVDRQIARLVALENTSDVNGVAAIGVRQTIAVAHETASGRRLPPRENTGDRVPCRQCDDLRTPVNKKRTRSDDERPSTLLQQSSKRGRTSAEPAGPNHFRFTEIVSSPKVKNISLFQKPKSGLYPFPSRPAQRGVGHRRNEGRGAVDAAVAIDDRGRSRTAKTCGPDAAVLASSRWVAHRSNWIERGSVDDGGKRAVLRGEHVISRKAIAQGMSDCLRCPVCSCAHSSVHMHARPRVQRASGIPCALYFREGERYSQTSGGTCRENEEPYLLGWPARNPEGTSVGTP